MSYIVVAEREELVMSQDLQLLDALNIVMAAHYIFNIKYDRNLIPVYQHYHFNIKEKRLPVKVTELKTLIDRMTCN